MKPTLKAKELENFIKKETGLDRVAAITTNTCVFCKDPDLNFRDQLSEKEYTISGICQKCQDDVFGG